MNTAKTAIAILIISLFSIGLFSSQKTTTPKKNSPMHDTVKTGEIQKKGHQVKLPTFATPDNIDFLMKEKKAVLLHYGFAPVYNPEFEKKYGINIINQGCVVMPSQKISSESNNEVVVEFLTKNFGEGWKKELGFQPFGTGSYE